MNFNDLSIYLSIYLSLFKSIYLFQFDFLVRKMRFIYVIEMSQMRTIALHINILFKFLYFELKIYLKITPNTRELFL